MIGASHRLSWRSLLTPGLAGWLMAGRGGFRWAGDDAIESHGGPGLLWYAAEAFDDFVLEVAWRLTHPDDNSGVFLRAPPLEQDLGPAIERGYEIQIDDRGFDPATGQTHSPLHRTGAVYKLAPAERLLSGPVATWNRFRIEAHGPVIAVAVNGEPASTLRGAARERSGHIALQCHHEGSAVRFRDLRIRPIGDS